MPVIGAGTAMRTEAIGSWPPFIGVQVENIGRETAKGRTGPRYLRGTTGPLGASEAEDRHWKGSNR